MLGIETMRPILFILPYKCVQHNYPAAVLAPHIDFVIGCILLYSCLLIRNQVNRLFLKYEQFLQYAMEFGHYTIPSCRVEKELSFSPRIL